MANHWSFTAFMTLLTIYALFGDDIRLCATDKSADDIFFGLTSLSLAFFAIEIVLNSIAREGYFLGFFFWLDLISTVSLITDIGWIWDEITGTSDSNAEDAQQASKLARGSRGAKIGSRAGRIARVIRLIRLIRVVKLYKSANYTMMQGKEDDKPQHRKSLSTVNEPLIAPKELGEPSVLGGDGIGFSRNAREDETLIRLNRMNNTAAGTHFEDFRQAYDEDDELELPEAEEEENFDVPQESKVGKKLSDLTTRRTIILVLAMLFSVPLFSESTYLQDPDPFTISLTMLSQYPIGTEEFEEVRSLVWDEMRSLRTPIISLYYRGLDVNGQADEIQIDSSTSPDDLRSSETELVTVGDFSGDTFGVAIYDLRENIVL